MQFTKNVDELVELFGSQKCRIVEFIKKNFKKGVHFVEEANNKEISKRGGHNRIIFLLTEETFGLVKNTFNLKNRYIKKINENCGQVNVVMAIEAQTVGFIENSFSSALILKRQKHIGPYYIDLYFEEYNIAVECDENDHNDRNPAYERMREDFLLKQNITIVRYNPNHKNFDLSDVIRVITQLIFCKPSSPSVVRVEF
jgi:very-short-patch-repair endonuclease